MQLDPDSIQTLCTIGDVDVEVAKRLLQKHDGNIEKAADALLAGDKGEPAAQPGSSTTWPQRTNTPEYGYNEADVPSITIGPQLPGASRSLVDLTESSGADAGPKFGPSNRAPNPDWQMVPSNMAVGGGRAATPIISHEDQSLNDAIQRSLDDFAAVGEKEDTSFKQVTAREGGRPVALRPETPALACAALVVHSLYFVPQVRHAIAKLRLPDVQRDTPLSHSSRNIWNLIELFANLDLAQLSAIVDSDVLPSLEEEGEKLRVNDSPGERATAIVNHLAQAIEAHQSAQEDDEIQRGPFFSFTHVHAQLNNRFPRSVGRPNPGAVVRLDIGGDQHERELVGALASVLSQYQEEGKSRHDLILDPSEFLCFCLGRSSTNPEPGKNDSKPFSFPPSFYLDRFMFRNLELTNQKYLQGLEISRDISELRNQRMTLSQLNQRDTVQDIKNTIYYYEKVANAKDEPSRQRVIEETVTQLKDILLIVESKIEGLDREIKRLEAKRSSLFDCPELQQHQYDLRAVLMHTGLPGHGRKQLYSYVKDAEGTWWKTCDYEVTQVSEDIVLSDTTGVHLRAGPFMLFYSKYLPNEELRKPVVWPPNFTKSVEENNRRFFALFPPAEVAVQAKVPVRSPPPPSPRAHPVAPQRLATPSPRSAHYPQPIRPNQMGPRGPTHHRAGSSLSARSFDASNDTVQ
ncbi:hypothetical protein DFP72DRAFT_906842 [Ephemerocybe angulata]|uniref:UBA domain-containing protein n=1 Tax=Ephemerocybe angulata TaxID=980116 RepID=A0A8H6M263_9AGAR|nr:hypothetical protein DFP72DRAFT_906842 [Tulosesus angulatus]